MTGALNRKATVNRLILAAAATAIASLLPLSGEPGGKEAAGNTKGKPAPPVELGTVKWGRDLDAALRQSVTSGKPVLVLFQEVPG